MKIDHDSRDEIDILSLEGRIDAITSAEFETRILEVASGVKFGIVLDFGKVDYVSSAGLRVLLVGVRALAEDNHTLVVACPSKNVKEVITLTGFHKLLKICDSVNDAVEIVRENG